MKPIIQGRALSCLLAGSAMWLSASTASMAQSAAAEVELEEVTVTAEKRETNLQKTAISIQVYSGEELAKEGKKRIDEIMQGVVGVGARDSQVGNVFFMRGVDAGGGGGTPATAFATTVSVLVDGVYQSRGETVRGGTLDLAQAEVMRGTQSTNLGVNALAGAVSLVTNKPVLGEYQANATVEIGDYNLLSMEGVANIPLADRHALRFAYAQNNRDGYIANDAGNSKLMNARLKYRFQPNDNLDMVFTAGRQTIGGNGVQQGALTYSGRWVPYSAATAAAGGYRTILGYPAIYGLVATPGVTYKDRDDPWDDGMPKNRWPNSVYRDTVIETYSGELNWTTRLGTLTVLPSVERATLDAQEPPRGTGTTFNAQRNIQDSEQVDVRFASTTDRRVTWLAGAFYYNTWQSGPFMTSSYPNEVPGYGNCGPTNNSPQIINNGNNICRVFTYSEGGVKSTSAYGNLTFKVTDEFRLKGGLRWTQDKKAQTFSRNRPQGGFDYIGGADTLSGPTFMRLSTPAGQTTCPGYACVGGFNYMPFTGFLLSSAENTWDNTAYSAGIEYDLRPDLMVYAAYQTGYQPGIINTMGAAANAPAVVFSPENTSKQITAGFKSRWLENKLQLNVEAFMISMKDRPFGGNNSNLLVVGDASNAQCQTFAPPTLASNVALSRPAVPPNYSCLAPLVQMVADNESKGLDVEISFLPTANDRVDLSLEYLDATYSSRPNLAGFNPTVQTIIDSANANTAPPFVAAGTPTLFSTNPAQATALATGLLAAYNARLDSFVGKQLQNASKYSANFTYQHRFNFSDGKSLSPRINAEYKDKYWSQGGTFPPNGFGQVDLLDEGSLVRQDSYVLWNFSLDFATADNKFSVNAYVKNIENKPIMLNIGGEPGVTVNYISLAPPRTMGVVFNARL